MEMHDLSGGGKLVILTGGPRLLVPGVPMVEVIILSRDDEVVTLRRHWSAEKDCTEGCTCTPLCPSSRLDRCFVGVVRVGHDMWEHRLLVVSEEGWASLERQAAMRYGRWTGLRGLQVTWRRVGPTRNARQQFTIQDFHPDLKTGSPHVPTVVRALLHVAADFFGLGIQESVGKKAAQEQTVLPARSRSDKPRVPKGKK